MSTPTQSEQPSDGLRRDLLGRAGAGGDADWPEDSYYPAMDPLIKSIQPGGGMMMSMELAWGRLRRAYLRRFRSGYVAHMAARRQGERGDLPIDPIDARDLKFYRNQDGYWWADADDPFLWRDSLPVMRVGLAEVFVLTAVLLLFSVLLAFLWWPLFLPPLLAVLWVVWCFRNPRRVIANGSGTVVSPADGKLVEIAEVDDPAIGPALRFGVQLSIFDARANRISLPGQVVSVRYRAGKSFNVLHRRSTRQYESFDLGLAATELDGRMIRIRQTSGPLARQVICWARAGDVFERGETYGVIKMGSRTELIIPRIEGLVMEAKIGDKILAGRTVMAQYPIELPSATAVPPRLQTVTHE